MKNVIENCIQDERKLTDALFDVMADKSCHFPDNQMIKQGGENSPMAPFHPKLACINVDISEKGYGTRVTTLILVDNDNNVTFIEKCALTNYKTVHKFKF